MANRNGFGQREQTEKRDREGCCGCIEISAGARGSKRHAVEAAAVPIAIFPGLAARRGVARVVARRLCRRTCVFQLRKNRLDAPGNAQRRAKARLKYEGDRNRQYEIRARPHSPFLQCPLSSVQCPVPSRVVIGPASRILDAHRDADRLRRIRALGKAAAKSPPIGLSRRADPTERHS